MNPELVKDARTRLGMTHQAFAEALGVSRRTVIRWETGESEPRPGDALLIGKLVGRKLEERDEKKRKKRNDR
jgi:DNA-binding transcriptional regulator YiaG